MCAMLVHGFSLSRQQTIIARAVGGLLIMIMGPNSGTADAASPANRWTMATCWLIVDSRPMPDVGGWMLDPR